MSTFVSTPAEANGPLVLLGRIVEGTTSRAGAVVIDDGRIVAVEPDGTGTPLPTRRLRAAYVAAGFVDLQVNGGFGHEVGEDPAALRALARRLPSTGVTSFLPTLVSRPEREYGPAFAALDEVMGEGAPTAARILGVHLEGPLLSRRRAGAHAADAIAAATPALLDRIAEPRRVRLVTLAPEVPGALALIARLRARGIVVSLGHTDASFEAFTAGVDAGATLATHVWNAMAPFHHRAPGATGAALADARITALAIADGLHTHPATFAVTVRAKGLERLGLVTDAIAGTGATRGGRTTLAGQAVTVDATGARLADGTLAGSTLTMDLAVRNARQFAALSAEAALHLASAVPARALGDGAPPLRPGAPADLVLLDDDLTVLATVVGGRLVYVRNDDVDALRA
ncbi:MAG TPA: N-acetylglucosamine-6-phosphate deacetylase [Polyangia bacterium]|jgi:N-acetylglucosamine-6-phosphate deacetylase